MKAVILAAGEGKRMHPLTYTRPKVMVPIANRPIMEHLLIEMKEAGITGFVMVVGYHHETIRQHFGDGAKWGVRIEYVPQTKQLGTAHAVRMVSGRVNGKFLLANGDVLVQANSIKRVLAEDRISLSLIEAEDTTGLGVVEVDGDKIVAIHEKVYRPPTNLANAGVYLMTPDIFPAIDRTRTSPRGEYELTDSLQMLLDEGYAMKWVTVDQWLDVSYPWDLLTANEWLMEQIESQNLGTIEDGVTLKGRVLIGSDTIVRSGSYIEGPVSIGDNCDIGPNCYIRPSTAIGDRCRIGAAVEVKNSIVMNDTNIPHHNYVGDSVIGANCNLGSGTKVANLRLDRDDISVAGIPTKRRKLGTIMGDNVQTGINSSINIGCLIGNNSFIGPGAFAYGVILPNSIVF
jgi:bifunctional UDP-N-acetylglucosamine pyrophosphorylase/glucosamine-1-phosphate N-acetyltransferase